MNTEKNCTRRPLLAFTACAGALLFSPQAVAGQMLPPGANVVREATRAVVTPWLHGGPGDDSLRGSEQPELIHGYDGDDVIRGDAGNDYLFGGAGDDLLLGGTGDDDLSGGDGADRLVGGSGDDALQGGRGDDVLRGGSGDDYYVFARDFGRDVIREGAMRDGGRDVIVFTSLRSTHARFLRRGDDLFILDLKQGQRVQVQGHFAAPRHRVETVRFSDGKTIDLAEAFTPEQG